MLQPPFLTSTLAVILVLLLPNAIQTTKDSPKCSSIERHEIELHLSTKTPYRVIANKDNSPIEFPGCQATRIWSVIRHGTRNPSKEVVESAQANLMRLKQQILSNSNTKMCPEELSRLRYWQFNVSTAEEKFLVAEGEDELIELAERIQNRFPTLLPDWYDPNLYYFKYTKTQRTLKSAESFATGLFGRHHIGEIIYPEALSKDPVLRVLKFAQELLLKNCFASNASIELKNKTDATKNN